MSAILIFDDHPRPTRLLLGPLEIDLFDRTAARSGKPLNLRAREYALLVHLARNAGQFVPRRTLLRTVWRLENDPGTNVVEAHVSRLRARLDRGWDAPMLRTWRGRGYCLDAPGDPF
jgi:two-component system OmpR family response regulator